MERERGGDNLFILCQGTAKNQLLEICTLMMLYLHSGSPFVVLELRQNDHWRVPQSKGHEIPCVCIVNPVRGIAVQGPPL